MGAPGEPDRVPPLGVVLAGGRGARLGGAKATVGLAGRPLVSYPLAALAAAGLERRVVAKPGGELPELDGARLLVEPPAPRHPLCGIVAALRAAPGRAVLAVPCDMPFLAPALLELLAGAPEPLVVLSHEGRVQPLPGRYAPALLPELEAALARGEPLRRTVEALGARVVGERDLACFGDPARLLLNVNDDGDLRRAEQLLVSANGSP
ncbi:MAG TPA: NTP transferase domain-containing protein [Solirubrobacterales bacterium]|nr:NTP transferase domain-containing protein [Solirubrobacterales bacterium]